MVDETDPTVDESTEVTPGTEAPAGGESQETSGNPAWEPIRSSLDEATYGLIEPHLREMDKAAQQRITAQNAKYGWAGKLTEAGRTPEEVEAAVAFAQQVAENPVAIFNNLRGFVETNYPEDYAKLDWIMRQQEAAAAGGVVDEDENGAPVDPRIADLERQLAELGQSQEQQRAFLDQQEQTRLYNEASTQIDADIQRVRASRPELQNEDWKDILTYAGRETEARHQAGNEKPVTIDEAVQWYDTITNRAVTRPRPGDSAPTLLPSGGGNAGGFQKPDFSKMSDAEITDFIAQDMAAKNKQS